MLGIVTTNAPLPNKLFSRIVPYGKTKDNIGTKQVIIYTLHKCWKPLFPILINRLKKSHSTLIFAKEMNREEPEFSALFFERLPEILSLTHRGIPWKIAVLCQKDHPKLWPLLQTAGPFVKTVSLVTEEDSLFEKISEQAMQELGLTVNRRKVSELENCDLIVCLWGKYNLCGLGFGHFINLSEEEVPSGIPSLFAVTNPEVSGFLSRHSYLHLNPSLLLAESDPISSCIWKSP